MGKVCSKVYCGAAEAKSKMSATDKIANLLAGCSFDLAGLADPSLRPEEALKKLKAIRPKMAGLGIGGYEKEAEKLWKVSEAVVTRPAEQGGPIKVLLHVPKESEAQGPLYVVAHGGGMVLGAAKDTVLRQFFQTFPAKVGCTQVASWVSVDYRLAPEHKFPAAIDDMMAVVDAMESKDWYEAMGYKAPPKIALYGVSAGALVAGHTAVRMAKQGKPPVAQALVCAMSDPEMAAESYRLYDLPMCPVQWLEWCWKVLLPAGMEPKEMSLFHLDWSMLKGCDTIVMIAAADPFEEDNHQLSKILTDAGVSVKTVVGKGSHVLGITLDESAAKEFGLWFMKTSKL